MTRVLLSSLQQTSLRVRSSKRAVNPKILEIGGAGRKVEEETQEDDSIYRQTHFVTLYTYEYDVTGE